MNDSIKLLLHDYGTMQWNTLENKTFGTAVDIRLYFASASVNKSTAVQFNPVTTTYEPYNTRISNGTANSRYSD